MAPKGAPISTSTGTGLRLEQLSVAVLNVVTTRDFSDPVLDYLSPMYKSTSSVQAIAHDRAQHLENMKEITKMNPDYRLVMLNTSSEVDEKKGTASVWITYSGTGFLSGGLGRESVRMVKWERNKGRWCA